MSFGSISTALRTHFAANWGATTIAWGNAPFTPPAPPAPFVRFDTIETGVTPYGFNSGRFRHAGSILVQVSVPEATGEGVALALVDAVIALYRLAVIADVDFLRDVQIQKLGPSGDGWHQWSVVVPYTFDTPV